MVSSTQTNIKHAQFGQLSTIAPVELESPFGKAGKAAGFNAFNEDVWCSVVSKEYRYK